MQLYRVDYSSAENRCDFGNCAVFQKGEEMELIFRITFVLMQKVKMCAETKYRCLFRSSKMFYKVALIHFFS